MMNVFTSVIENNEMTISSSKKRMSETRGNISGSEHNFELRASVTYVVLQSVVHVFWMPERSCHQLLTIF